MKATVDDPVRPIVPEHQNGQHQPGKNETRVKVTNPSTANSHRSGNIEPGAIFKANQGGRRVSFITTEVEDGETNYVIKDEGSGRMQSIPEAAFKKAFSP